MKIGFRYSNLALIVLVWSLVGFQFLAGVVNFLGYPSTAASLSVRSMVAGVSLALVAAAMLRKRTELEWGIILLIVFWAIYCVRLLYDILSAPHLLGQPSYIYYSFAIGGCLIPSTALALHGRSFDAERVSNWLIGLGVVFLTIVFFIGYSEVFNEFGEIAYDAERIRIDSVNPIKVGDTAASVLLCVYWRMRLYQPPTGYALFLLAIAVFCLWMLFETGTRGPFVALVAGVIFLEAVKGGLSLLLVSILCALLIAAVGFDLTAIDDAFGTTTFARLDVTIN